MNASLLKIYDYGVFVLSLFVWPFFLLKKRGRSRLLERYGFWKIKKDEYIWFHAASLGEVKGILPLIKKIKQEKPNQKILLTTTSVTGLDEGKDFVDENHLMAFDSSIYHSKIFKKFSPIKIIISETEIWPSFITYYAKKGIPLFLINARISNNTINKYKKLSWFITPILNKFTKILVQSNKDFEYFEKINVDKNILSIAGNSKYEFNPKIKSPYEALELSKKYFPDSKINKIITLASIRPNEEKILFPILKTLYENNEDIGIIVAPRHKEKFSYFEDELKDQGFKFTKWSDNNGGKKDYQVVLLDTYGELEKIFSFSNLVFIGASLINIGGHNPMEAMQYGAYVFMGEYFQNYFDIVNELLLQNAISIVRTKEDIEELCIVLLNTPSLLKEKGAIQKEFCKHLMGATEKILKEI